MSSFRLRIPTPLPQAVRLPFPAGVVNSNARWRRAFRVSGDLPEYSKAESFYRQALELRKEVLGEGQEGRLRRGRIRMRTSPFNVAITT